MSSFSCPSGDGCGAARKVRTPGVYSGWGGEDLSLTRQIFVSRRLFCGGRISPALRPIASHASGVLLREDPLRRGCPRLIHRPSAALQCECQNVVGSVTMHSLSSLARPWFVGVLDVALELVQLRNGGAGADLSVMMVSWPRELPTR